MVWVYAEGPPPWDQAFQRAAEQRGVAFRGLSAERWREDLLLSRERRSGSEAKVTADQLARQVIAWSGLSLPKSLRHDAAEAVLMGLWAAREVGWLSRFPELSR